MNWLLDFYIVNEDWISLAKDVAFFLGFLGFFVLLKFLWNFRFDRKSRTIRENLEFREKMESTLKPYIFDKAKGTKDIAIRFVHWKNYPANLSDDGFKRHLRIQYEDDKPWHGWIDNTGINFEDGDIWFLGNSVYVDKNGISFIGPKGNEHDGFEEISNIMIVFHLPFTNIVDFDFREYIEYEPVFYIRYPYTNFRKLYDDEIVLRERQGNEYFSRALSLRKLMRKYSWTKYQLLKLKFLLIGSLRAIKG